MTAGQHEHKPEWIAELNGQEFDLRRITRMGGAEWSIQDDGEWFGLHSQEFQDLGDAGQVRECAAELLTHILNVARLRWPDLEPVQVTSVRRVGDPSGNGVFVWDTLNVRARASVEATAVVVNAGGEVVEERRPVPDTPPSAWVKLARREPAVARALRMLAEGSWDNYYKALEVVQEDVGGRIIRDGWASKTELDRFTATANNARVLGDDARHGHEKWLPPSNPMTLDGARALMIGVVTRWIEWKALTSGSAY